MTRRRFCDPYPRRFAGLHWARAGLVLMYLVGVMVVLAMALIPAVVTAQDSPLHPTFPLLDHDGENVLDTGQPVSTLATCGSCHDAEFITSHDMHAQVWATRDSELAWDPVRYGELPVEGDEMNCFLCHSSAANNEAREAALAADNMAWANTATLVDSGIVLLEAGGYVYDRMAFDESGSLLAEYTRIQDPRSDACGACHGQVHLDNQVPLAVSVCDQDEWRTFTTGQIVSPQRISGSGANIVDKNTLTQAWDVHAERVLNCVDCHYGVNNPVFALDNPATAPEHLTFDPRRLDFGEYLERPSHVLASGSNNAPSCESCHNAEVAHPFLPYLERHTTALACESCHVPQLYAPALAARDWTVVNPDGAPIDVCRGIGADSSIAAPPDEPSAALVSGYQPVLLQSVEADGTSALSPYNLVTVSYWADAQGVAVPLEVVRAAYLDGDNYAEPVLDMFDADGDGTLSEVELTLNSEAKRTLIADRLAEEGINSPSVVAEVVPFSIHHSVVDGAWATQECQSCHSDNSRITAALPLGSPPAGVTPQLATTDGVLWNGSITMDANGQLAFRPETQTPAAQLYIFGLDSVAVVDTFGVLTLVAVSLGVTAHATLRVIAGRRAAKDERMSPLTVRRAYMYTIYERQWHWLQTVVIFGLIFSGLVIHRPQYFSAFSFAWMVDLHNVLALILVINALLSLFYHLATGEIKQFIPRPYGFFDQAIQQALYYVRGIFRGDPHPFEKSPARKMNPLQQLTYLMILNVLLPLQVLTGALMWGAQEVPALTNTFGGLPFLAPFHTLIAWLFATFIVAHVYLTTTGHEPLAGIKAMVGGYDDVETIETGAPVAEPGSTD